MMWKLENGTELQSTDNFVWSKADILGQGATSNVYKGREKKTGKEYAIKVFNSRTAGMRYAEARKREFDVLRKVNHENIIRLCKVEEETSSKREVIIMELCTGGNLQTLLDDPENQYGLPEKELKRVLKHITAGMKHLHDQDIVHRDLKPGNITRTFTEDGLSVYKLTDFGAARELGSEEHFQSLCGTEEYLHPDMYARAILKKSSGKKFSAAVDLWSIGVTLYQAATGDLPFRPYGGARKNKEIMLKITAEKPTGVISGTQHCEGGEIEWSKDLPNTCRLSEGFKRLFVPLLSGLLEKDPKLSWSFDLYFAEVENILAMRVFHVFSIPTASLHTIYISPDKRYREFQEQVASSTSIRISAQLLLFDGAQFQADPMHPASTYPHTSPDHPFILCSLDVKDFHRVSIPHTCKPPKVRSVSTSDNDASLAKVCSKSLFDIGKTINHLLRVQNLIRLGVKWFVSYLKSRIVQVQLTCGETESKLTCLKTSLEIFEEHYRQETSLLRVVSKVVSIPSVVNELTLYFIHITEKAKYLFQIQKEFDQLKDRLRTLEKSIIVEDVPMKIFIDSGSRSEERLKERISVCAEKSRQIFKSFRKYIDYPSVDEKRKHCFEKQKLSDQCDIGIGLLLEQAVPSCRRLHKESTSWFVNMDVCLKEVFECEKRFSELNYQCKGQVEPIRMLQKVYQQKMEEVEQQLYKKIDKNNEANKVEEITTH